MRRLVIGLALAAVLAVGSAHAGVWMQVSAEAVINDYDQEMLMQPRLVLDSSMDQSGGRPRCPVPSLAFDVGDTQFNGWRVGVEVSPTEWRRYGRVMPTFVLQAADYGPWQQVSAGFKLEWQMGQ